MSELTKFEEQILLSVWSLGEKAYGISIYDHIRRITGKKLAIGGIYFPLERLVEKGLLKARKGDPTPVRGGQSKRGNDPKQTPATWPAAVGPADRQG